MIMAKVAIFLANGFEEIEALTVVDLLRRANIEITMVSITGNIEVTGSHKITTKADALFENADFEVLDMLVLPGGMPGTKYLSEHAGLDRLLKSFHAKDKKLAAICAAPSVLGNKGLLKGKNATSYPGFEEALLGAHVMNAAVVMDGNIITSKGMGTAIDFSLSLIKSLVNEEEASKIAKSIQYQYYN
jgi:4-methyl-5(b-hydroxyethyl)-thiazole monophosphate biosynthesis